MEQQALPPEQAYLIWCLSWIGLFVGFFSVLRGYPMIGAFHFGCGCTSLLYWSNPDMTSWRRWLDIVWVQISVIGTVLLSWAAEYRYPFYACLALGAGLYGLGWLLVDSPWLSAFAHAGVHVCGNLATFVLVSGENLEET